APCDISRKPVCHGCSARVAAPNVHHVSDPRTVAPLRIISPPRRSAMTGLSTAFNRTPIASGITYQRESIRALRRGVVMAGTRGAPLADVNAAARTLRPADRLGDLF